MCAQPTFIVLWICSDFYKLGVAVWPVLFLVPLTERSTKEETPIARAVSGSLCVCVCVHAQPTDLRNTVYKGRDHLLIKDDEYQKEIHARNTVESIGQ